MACFGCGGSILEQDKELDNFSTFGSGEIKGWLEKLSKGSIWTSPHYQLRYFLLRSQEHGRYELQYFRDEIARQQGEPPRLSIDLSQVRPDDFEVLEATGKMRFPVPGAQSFLDLRAPANEIRDIWVEKIMFAIQRSNGLSVDEQLIGSRSRTATEDSEYDSEGEYEDEDEEDGWNSNEEKEGTEDAVSFKVRSDGAQSKSQAPPPPTATASASSPKISRVNGKHVEPPLHPVTSNAVAIKGSLQPMETIGEAKEDAHKEVDSIPERKQSRLLSKKEEKQRSRRRPGRARSLRPSGSNSFDFSAFSGDSLKELCDDADMKAVILDEVDGISAGEQIMIRSVFQGWSGEEGKTIAELVERTVNHPTYRFFHIKSTACNSAGFQIYIGGELVPISTELTKVAFGHHLEQLSSEKSAKALEALQHCTSFSFADVLTLVVMTIQATMNRDRKPTILFRNLTHPCEPLSFVPEVVSNNSCLDTIRIVVGHPEDFALRVLRRAMHERGLVHEKYSEVIHPCLEAACTIRKAGQYAIEMHMGETERVRARRLSTDEDKEKGGQQISYINVLPLEKMCPQNCIVIGPGLREFAKPFADGRPRKNTFYIFAVDRFGNICGEELDRENVELVVTRVTDGEEISARTTNVRVVETGLSIIDYQLDQQGSMPAKSKISVHVLVKKSPVVGSPFTVTVSNGKARNTTDPTAEMNVEAGRQESGIPDWAKIRLLYMLVHNPRKLGTNVNLRKRAARALRCCSRKAINDAILFTSANVEKLAPSAAAVGGALSVPDISFTVASDESGQKNLTEKSGMQVSEQKGEDVKKTTSVATMAKKASNLTTSAASSFFMSVADVSTGLEEMSVNLLDRLTNVEQTWHKKRIRKMINEKKTMERVGGSIHWRRRRNRRKIGGGDERGTWKGDISADLHFYKDGVPLPPSPILRVYEGEEEKDQVSEEHGGDGRKESDMGSQDQDTILNMASFVDVQNEVDSDTATPIVKGSLSFSDRTAPSTPTIKISAGKGGIFGETPTVAATFESPRWVPAGVDKKMDDGNGIKGTAVGVTPVIKASIMANEEKGQVLETSTQNAIESMSWQGQRQHSSSTDCGQIAVSLQSLLVVRDVLATTEMFWTPSSTQPIAGIDSYVKELRQYDRSFRERLFEDIAVGEIFETSVREILGMDEDERPPLPTLPALWFDLFEIFLHYADLDFQMSLSDFLHFLHDCSLLAVTRTNMRDIGDGGARFRETDSMTHSSATLVFRRLVSSRRREGSAVRLFEPSGALGSITFTLFYLALGDVAMRISPIRFRAKRNGRKPSALMRGMGLGPASEKEMDYLISFFVLGLSKHRHWNATPSRRIRYKPSTKSALGSRVLALSVGTALAVEKPLLRSDVLLCLDRFEPELQRVFGMYSSRPTAFVGASSRTSKHAGIFPDQIQQLEEDYELGKRFGLPQELMSDILSLILDTQTGLLDSLFGRNPLQAQENAAEGEVVWQRCWSRVISSCMRRRAGKEEQSDKGELDGSSIGAGSGEHSVGALSYAAFLDFLCQCALAARSAEDRDLDNDEDAGKRQNTNSSTKPVADAVVDFLQASKLLDV